METKFDSSDDFALIQFILDALTSSEAQDGYSAQPATLHDRSGGLCNHRSIDIVQSPTVAVGTYQSPDAVTTVMIRNIPRKCTQRMLVADLVGSGFDGTFDFVYLPTDISSAKNLGYAFVNFIHGDYVKSFRDVFHKRHLASMRGSRTGLSVSPALIQGYEANIENVMKNASVHRIRNPEYLPVIQNKVTGRMEPCYMDIDIKRRHSNTSQASTVSCLSASEWPGVVEKLLTTHDSQLKAV
jgi:hypothetical protein